MEKKADKFSWETPRMEKEILDSVLAVGLGSCTIVNVQPGGHISRPGCCECNGTDTRCSVGCTIPPTITTYL